VLAVVTAATIPGAALAAAPGDRAAEPRLVARAVLPADTFADGPPSGSAIGPGPINGRTPPFPSQPVQGFSALIGSGRAGVYLALADNGYGAKANSADFLLRAYRIRPRWERAGGGPGTVEVLGFVQFRDPDHRVAWPIVNQETDERLLTGADFDPESIGRAPDGTYWVGDEFGPFLLHFSAGGVLLEAPVPFPVPRRLSAYGGGQDEVRSPDTRPSSACPTRPLEGPPPTCPAAAASKAWPCQATAASSIPAWRAPWSPTPIRTAACCTPTTWPSAGSGTGRPTISPTPPPTPSAT
jgi:glycerophosphoryl diester phosphodiesterase